MIAPDSQPAEPLVEPLTRRELEIVGLLAQDQSAPEIAQRLSLAVSSVKWYLQQIYGKLGVNRKREAIARARALGVLESPKAVTLAQSATPLSAPPATPERKHNLPQQVTRFFGRENEIGSLI